MTLSLLCQTTRHFHTSEKYGTKQEVKKLWISRPGLDILLTAISSQEELNSFLVIEVYLPLITIFVICNTITKIKITANI